MTQEDKELLLKDLCARLPYGVNGRVYAETTKGEYDINGDMIFFDSPFDVTLDDINTSTEEIHVIAIGNEDMVDFIEDQQTWGDRYIVDEFKPYLRPMSSMTEEEREELRQEQIKDEQLFADCIKNHPEMRGLIIPHFAADWCDKNMFDYRGLIEKRLAISTEEFNPYKKERN